MPLKEVANEDLQISFSNTAGPGDLVYQGDQSLTPITIVAIPSTTCKAVGKYIETDEIVIVWGGACAFTSLTYNFTSGGGNISATATKTKADGIVVLRKGDTGSCAGSWKNKLDPPGDVSNCTCDIEISDAGQTKVKAQ